MRHSAKLLAFSCVLLSSAAYGAGSTAPGIVQGNSTAVAGHCWQVSAAGVAIDSGATCGTGASGVSQFSGGTTGLTPSTGTTGAITLAGTLGIANGGTNCSVAAIGCVTNITGATGTPSSTTYLRGDGTWSTPTSGGTPGGASFTIQYNNAGAFGGVGPGTGDDILHGGGAGPSFGPVSLSSSQVSGVLGSNQGGAGSINGILQANGGGIVSHATSGIDYAPATSGGSILSGDTAGGFSNVTVGSGLTFTGGTLAATGGGGVSLSSGSSNIVVSPNPITGTGTITASFPVNAQTGTTYALVAADGGKLVTLSNAAAVAVSLPQAGSTGFTSGWSVTVQNKGAGTVTITPATSTINGGATLAIATNTGCDITSDGTNYQVSACTAISAGTGTVTSVGMTGDGTVFNASVTGSPITTSGTLAPSLHTQTLNTVLAGPTSGGAVAPTFRALVSGDIPVIPVSTGLSGLGTGVGTALSLSVTGSGGVALATNAALTTPTLSTADITSTPLVNEIANAGTTGTTLHKLAKLTGAPSTLVVLGTSDTLFQGIVVGGAGTTGSAQIARAGQTTCVFDNATTAGDWVIPSATTGGNCHDTGATTLPSQEVVGRVLTTNGNAGTYAVDVSPQNPGASTGGGSVTWPTSADLVISNGTSSPAGLAPVNGDCVLAAAGAWTAGSCAGSAAVTSVADDGNGTMTVTPTTGAVTVALNLANPNAWTIQQSFSGAGSLSNPSVIFNGTLFTGGSGTTTWPNVILEDPAASNVTTWSTSGTYLGINAKSAFAGNFLDFHINGGGSVFKVSSLGTVTASTQFVAGGFTVNASGAPANGINLPAANSLGLYSNTTERMRFDSSGNPYLIGIASATTAQTGTVCILTTSTPSGELTYDPTNTCLSSLEELKDNHGSITSASALWETMKLSPFWGTWKKNAPSWIGGDHAVQPFLGAHGVEAIDPRLASYDSKGNLRSVRYQEMVAFLVADVQGLQEEIAALFVLILGLVCWNIYLTRKVMS